MLADFCSRYNACLQQRIEAYRRQRRTSRYGDQAAELRAVRGRFRPSRAGRSRLSSRSCDASRPPTRRSSRGRGFPRFRAASRYHAAAFRVGDGLSFRGTDRRLGTVGIPGAIKAVRHRALPPGAKLGTAVVTRQSGNRYVVFSVEAEFGGERVVGDVGIDLGRTALFAISDGHVEPAPRFKRRA